MKPEFWSGKRVFVTGHTGFKGSWLVRWLARSGAAVTGFALAPPTSPSLFEAAQLANLVESITGDVRDLAHVERAMHAAKPDVVLHLAAQPLVRASYDDPVGTYATNVMGTVHVLDAMRRCDSARVAIVVTSDKCYDNREWVWPYRENEPMGGKDPYSNSKGCAELVTAAYRGSFFAGETDARIATVRAGNVIGGGDWAKDRLVPDLIRAFANGEPALIRNPGATRPWQFVLDPLAGYLTLAEALWDGNGFANAWNFGPHDSDVHPVHWIADRLAAAWGDGAAWKKDAGENPPEAFTLKLDSSRARTLLGWEPKVPLGDALNLIVEFHKRFNEGETAGMLMDEQSDQVLGLRS